MFRDFIICLIHRMSILLRERDNINNTSIMALLDSLDIPVATT